MKKFQRPYYEVRVKGDGEFGWFVEPEEYSEWDTNYNIHSLASAKRFAKEVGGWVVKVTEELIK